MFAQATQQWMNSRHPSNAQNDFEKRLLSLEAQMSKITDLLGSKTAISQEQKTSDQRAPRLVPVAQDNLINIDARLSQVLNVEPPRPDGSGDSSELQAITSNCVADSLGTRADMAALPEEGLDSYEALKAAVLDLRSWRCLVDAKLASVPTFSSSPKRARSSPKRTPKLSAIKFDVDQPFREMDEEMGLPLSPKDDVRLQVFDSQQIHDVIELEREIVEDHKKLGKLEGRVQNLELGKTISFTTHNFCKLQNVIGEFSTNGLEYSWEESIWVTCTLIGSMGWFSSMTSLFLYVINAFTQVTFTIVVWSRMTDPIYSKQLLVKLDNWRSAFGNRFYEHSGDFDISVLEAVCNRSVQMTEWSTQEYHLNEIDDYLTWAFGLNGVALTMLAIGIWLLKIWEEMNNIGDWALGVLSLYQRGKIRRPRLMGLFFGIFVPRLAIGVYLGITGVKYLAVTTNLPDIILNCVALGTVLDLDELIYHALVSPGLKHAMRRLEPLRFPLGDHKIRKAIVCLKIVFIFGFLFVIRLFVLQPMTANMKSARKAICGEL